MSLFVQEGGVAAVMFLVLPATTITTIVGFLQHHNLGRNEGKLRRRGESNEKKLEEDK
jgi:hypothetical protein